MRTVAALVRHQHRIGSTSTLVVRSGVAAGCAQTAAGRNPESASSITPADARRGVLAVTNGSSSHSAGAPSKSGCCPARTPQAGQSLLVGLPQSPFGDELTEREIGVSRVEPDLHHVEVEFFGGALHLALPFADPHREV